MACRAAKVEIARPRAIRVRNGSALDEATIGHHYPISQLVGGSHYQLCRRGGLRGTTTGQEEPRMNRKANRLNRRGGARRRPLDSAPPRARRKTEGVDERRPYRTFGAQFNSAGFMCPKFRDTSLLQRAANTFLLHPRGFAPVTGSIDPQRRANPDISHCSESRQGFRQDATDRNSDESRSNDPLLRTFGVWNSRAARSTSPSSPIKKPRRCRGLE